MNVGEDARGYCFAAGIGFISRGVTLSEDALKNRPMSHEIPSRLGRTGPASNLPCFAEQILCRVLCIAYDFQVISS